MKMRKEIAIGGLISVFLFFFVIIPSINAQTIYYRFNDGGIDSSGSGYNCSLRGNAAIASGYMGNSLHLDGADDYCGLGENDATDPIDNGKNITIAFWFKTNISDGTASARIVDKDSAFSITYHSGDDELRCRINNVTGTSEVQGNIVIPINTWTHGACVYNGTAIAVYVNGTLANQGNFSGALNDSNKNLSIGIDVEFSNTELNGSVDEVRIYTRALESSELLSLYNSYIMQPGSIYYVDADAECSNVAGTELEPFCSLSNLTGKTFAANDTIYFDDDDIFRGNYTFDDNDGTVASPIKFLSNGTGQARIWGSYNVTSCVSLGGNIWQCLNGTLPNTVNMVFFNTSDYAARTGQPTLGFRKTSCTNLTDDRDYCYNSSNDAVLIYFTAGNPATLGDGVEASNYETSADAFFYINQKNNILIENLSFSFANEIAVSAFLTSNVNLTRNNLEWHYQKGAYFDADRSTTYQHNSMNYNNASECGIKMLNRNGMPGSQGECFFVNKHFDMTMSYNRCQNCYGAVINTVNVTNLSVMFNWINGSEYDNSMPAGIYPEASSQVNVSYNNITRLNASCINRGAEDASKNDTHIYIDYNLMDCYTSLFNSDVSSATFLLNGTFRHNTIILRNHSSNYANERALYMDNIANLTLEDNLFYLDRGNDDSFIFIGNTYSRLWFNYNLYFNTRGNGNWTKGGSNYNGLSIWQTASGNDSNSIYGYPDFVNFSIGDYRPYQSGMACNISSSGSYVGALPCVDNVPPNNITGLTIPSYDNQSIYLFWTNPSNTDLNHSEIYANGDFVVNITGNNYNVTGLTSDTTYYFVLRPVDQLGNKGNNATINGTTLSNSFSPGGCELQITRFGGQATFFNMTLSNSSRVFNITFCQRPYISNASMTLINYNTSNNVTQEESNSPTCTGSVNNCANAYDGVTGTSASITPAGSGYVYHNYDAFSSHRKNITVYSLCGASASTVIFDCYNGGWINLFTDNAPCSLTERELSYAVCGNAPYQFRTFIEAGLGGQAELRDVVPVHYYAHNITTNNLNFHSEYYAERQTKSINFTTAARNVSSNLMYVNFSYLGNITWQNNFTMNIVYNKTINVTIVAASNLSNILNPTCTYNGNTIYPKTQLLNYTSSLDNTLVCNISGYSDASWYIIPDADTYNLTMDSATLYLTVLDEETDRQITENVTLMVISSQSIVNYTIIAGGINISSLPNGEIELRYGSSPYVTRSYFATITSNTSIDLYTLKNTSATLILFYIPDERGNPVFNGTLKMLRQFANRSSIWRTVAMEKIDDNGISGIYLVANDVYYDFVIEKGGVMLATYGPQKVFSSPVVLQAPVLENVLTSYVSVRDSITTSLTWNNATNIVTYTWNDASGITQHGCLDIIELTAFRRTTKASSCGSSATGSIQINTTSFIINATYTAKGYLITSTTYSEPITDLLVKVFGKQHDTYGKFGLYIGYILIGTLFLTGLALGGFSFGLLFSGIGMFFVQTIGMAFFGPQLIITFIIIGFVIAVANRI